ncbi:penicillin acylase family protein [Halopseudomonas pachastrellae]|nr:penicillin acylase family protein [Halopseudomonas pachastrellae]
MSVYYDAWGVPHIDAQSEHDAYLALGYVHAQDRLFQMDLLRRIGGGRLSELFGASRSQPTGSSGPWASAATPASTQSAWNNRPDSPQVQLIHAYQDGINQYIDQGGRALEYRLLMTKRTTSAPRHRQYHGYMAYSFAEAFKTDALVDTIRGTLSERHYRDLVPSWPDQLPRCALPDSPTSNC